MNKFFINCFDFRFVLKKLGKTRIKTAIKRAELFFQFHQLILPELAFERILILGLDFSFSISLNCSKVLSVFI